MRKHYKSGFTLVEIMIVVVIIGLLAAIAIPAFTKSRENARSARFANDVRVFAGMIETFSLESGDYPEDSSSGNIPTGFEEYIRTNQWTEGTPFGGVWDVENSDYSVTCAIGVHRYTVSNDHILRFDQKFDDGALNTGRFRKLDSDRYYFVIAE